MKEKWINVGKFLAILAVMVDHTNGVLYINQGIAYGSYFSVSLFILLMGITTYYSYEKSKITLGKKVMQRIKGIAIPYIVATVISSIFIYHFFDLQMILQMLLQFSGPHYFVLLYVQLLLVSPVMFVVVHWCESRTCRLCCYLGEFLFGGVLLVFAAWTTNYSNLLNIYGGGGKLFGGTYIILLYLGMLFGARKKIFDALRWWQLLIGALVFGGMAFGVWNHMRMWGLTLDAKLPFGGGYNPPSISFASYALCVMALVYCVVRLIEMANCSIANVLINGLDFGGRYTLSIFLYHRLFLDWVCIRYLGTLSMGMGKCIVYFGIMLGGSFVLDFVLGKAIKYIKYCYSVKN